MHHWTAVCRLLEYYHRTKALSTICPIDRLEASFPLLFYQSCEELPILYSGS